MTNTHPATTALLPYFEHGHLPPHLAQVSEPFAELAQDLADTLEGPEVTVALRKLLEAKDCAVRAAVTQHKAREAEVLTNFVEG